MRLIFETHIKMSPRRVGLLVVSIAIVVFTFLNSRKRDKCSGKTPVKFTPKEIWIHEIKYYWNISVQCGKSVQILSSHGSFFNAPQTIVQDNFGSYPLLHWLQVRINLVVVSSFNKLQITILKNKKKTLLI